MVKSHGAEVTSRLDSLLGRVRVVEVPNVGRLGHVGRHLLESQVGVGGGNAHLGGAGSALGMPGDLCAGSLDRVGILENHNGLCRNVFGEVFGLLAIEILLKQVDLVVLSHAVHGALGELLGCGGVAKGLISEESLVVLLDIVGLGGVELFGPSSPRVFHATVIGSDALGVNRVLRHNGDVVQDDLVGVSNDEFFLLAGYRCASTNNLDFGVIELGGTVTAEITSGL